jgi:DNA polymerase V
MRPVFALVDCNSFYASCEQVFDPRLRNRPVVVLSNNDGCVIARSAEAKAVGIRMAEPFFEQQDLILKHGVQVFSANFTLYGDMSNRVMEVLRQFSPGMEVYSIDEAFLDLTGFQGSLEDYGRKIKNTVHRWTGIPTSIGIGPTKTLSKIANRIAKKEKAARGVFDITDHPEIDRLLESIEVGDVWGIGRRYAKFLNSRGVTNARQLRDLPVKFVRQRMTVIGLRTVTELRGQPCIELDQAVRDKKNLLSSRSFGQPVRERAEMEQAVAEYASMSAEKLRRQASRTSAVSVFIETDTFRDGPQYRNFATAGLPVPTAYTPEIIRAAHRALDRIFLPGYAYKKAGVMLSEVVPDSRVQLDAFAYDGGIQVKQSVMRAMDSINARMGRNKVFYAAQGMEKTWGMRQKRLSRRFTTRWDEIPTVKA